MFVFGAGRSGQHSRQRLPSNTTADATAKPAADALNLRPIDSGLKTLQISETSDTSTSAGPAIVPIKNDAGPAATAADVDSSGADAGTGQRGEAGRFRAVSRASASGYNAGAEGRAESEDRGHGQ